MRYSTFALWQAAASATLASLYGITTEDAGADEAELRLYYADHAERGATLTDFADAYAEDRDLDTPDAWTRKDLARLYPVPKPDQCATPEQVARATAPVSFTGDPEYGGALPEGMGFARGSYGSIGFDLKTGKVVQHWPGVDFDGDDMSDFPEGSKAWNPGYLDIVSVNLADLEPGQTGTDICYIGFTTDDGTYVAKEEPLTED